MSATDELCRMLDERGVEHEGGKRSLRWRDRYGIMMQAFPLANGELGMEVWSCTPAQAIAATLGPCSDSCSCTNGERTDLAAENAKLREELESVGIAAYLYGRSDLKAENDKLRELIRKLIGLDSLYEVPMCNVNEWSRRMDSIHDEMRELGVEADG